MQKDPQFKVYQASAGSGKTFTLIKEYLKLCLASEQAVGNYKRILAITFTNAAANEMKDKIVKALVAIIGSTTVNPNSMEASLIDELGINDTELKRNAQRLMTCIMHDYSSFCVSTIDAFVQKLSRSFAHDLGLPSQYTVSIDDEEVADAITERIGLRIGSQDPYLTDMLVAFCNSQFDLERSTDIETQLVDFIEKLLKEKAGQNDEGNMLVDSPHYEVTLAWLKKKTETFEKTVDGYVKRVRDVERQYGLSVEDYWYKSSGVCAHIGRLEQHEYLKDGKEGKELLLGGNFSKAIKEKKCLGDTKRQTENQALLDIIEPLKAYYDDNIVQYLFYKSQSKLLYLYAVRSKIREAFKQLAEEEEIVHISEFNKLLNTVMGDFSVPFVYERIGEQFQHVFVDEFQDTSILQWQNLLPLVHNGLSNGHMSMVVGDGKQSIYRFRSGEVEQIASLPEIYGKPVGDDREEAFRLFEQKLKDTYLFQNLGTNYRSFAQVVDFNNAFFEAAYRQLSDKHRKVYVDEKPGTDEVASIFQKKAQTEEGLVQVELYDPESQSNYCCERIEALIRELVDKHGYRFEDIAVLTRKSEPGAVIANYLNDKKIPVISQVSVLLKTSDRVQLLVNTLRYLLHDDNEVDVAKVLYYRNVHLHPEFEGDMSHWFDEAKAVANGTTPIETVMGLGEPGQLKAALSKSTCLYDLCAALMRIYRIDTISDAFLNYFMEEVFRFQSGIKESIVDFLQYWDAKQDKLSIMSVSGNAVKIMTIHKSKGLEFPVVIYPDAIIDLDERLNKSKSPEEWLHPEELGFEAIPNLGRVLFKMDSTARLMGPMAAERCQKEKESNRLDNLNLLYVAFTRPVQRLYVIAKQVKEGKPNIIRDILNDKKDHLVADGEVVVYRFGDPDFRNPKAKDADAEVSATPESTSLDWFQRISVDADPTRLWRAKSGRLQPREWGERVHEILSKVRYPKDLDAVLKPYLADGTIDPETADWILERFMQMAQDPQIADAFSPLAKVKTESEILYQGKVIRLDRYAELPEAIYLIDYKTGKKSDEHHKQVLTYANALREMTDKEIRSFLVYLTEDAIAVERV